MATTSSTGGMLVETSDILPDQHIKEVLGLVMGSSARSKHIGSDLLAGLRNIVGGEVRQYSDLLDGARNDAIDRMVEQAGQLGANAVICVRFETSSIGQGVCEVLAYGTAVRKVPASGQ